MDRLTEPELAAIHQVLQAEGGLVTATGASEMVVTYPSQFRVHEAPTGTVAPEEFQNDGDDSNKLERQESGSVD